MIRHPQIIRRGAHMSRKLSGDQCWRRSMRRARSARCSGDGYSAASTKAAVVASRRRRVGQFHLFAGATLRSWQRPPTVAGAAAADRDARRDCSAATAVVRRTFVAMVVPRRRRLSHRRSTVRANSSPIPCGRVSRLRCRAAPVAHERRMADRRAGHVVAPGALVEEDAERSPPQLQEHRGGDPRQRTAGPQVTRGGSLQDVTI